MSKDLKALQSFTYGRRRLVEGDRFTARGSDARVLVALRRAAPYAEASPVPEQNQTFPPILEQGPQTEPETPADADVESTEALATLAAAARDQAGPADIEQTEPPAEESPDQAAKEEEEKKPARGGRRQYKRRDMRAEAGK